MSSQFPQKFESFENTLEGTVTPPEDSWPRWSWADPVGDQSFQRVVPVKITLENILTIKRRKNMMNKRWDRVEPWSLAQLQTMGVLHLWAGREKKFWWFLKQSSGCFLCFLNDKSVIYTRRRQHCTVKRRWKSLRPDFPLQACSLLRLRLNALLFHALQSPPKKTSWQSQRRSSFTFA